MKIFDRNGKQIGVDSIVLVRAKVTGIDDDGDITYKTESGGDCYAGRADVVGEFGHEGVFAGELVEVPADEPSDEAKPEGEPKADGEGEG